MLCRSFDFDLYCRKFFRMYNQNKIFRVLQLISLLQNKPPKTLRFIAQFLECTERTAYRYLDLIKKLGFFIEKDSYNKYFILETAGDELFTDAEAHFLVEILNTVGKTNKLRDSILSKIKNKSFVPNYATELLKAHLSKLVEKLNFAMEHKQQVVLKKYHSVNSNKISDRIVEPFQFTTNYSSICAFEIKSNQNKYFNIERIVDVELLKTKHEYTNAHRLEETDVFGFTEHNGEKFIIELELNLRAYLLFKEANVNLAPFMTKNKTENKYVLKVMVNNPKPIVSLIRGFKDDVKIIGSDFFIDYLELNKV